MASYDKPINIELTIRYTGIKATQYFSKFSPESDAVFRNDLLILKIPHPKRDNTQFLLHGVVKCHWDGVQRNGLLHKQVVERCNAPEHLLRELSIVSITPKFDYLSFPASSLPPKPLQPSQGLKRANPDTLTDTNRANPSRSKAWPLKYDFSNASNNAPGSSHNTSDDRPHKKARLGLEDASFLLASKQSPTFPTFTNLAPLPPRTQGIPNTRVFLPNRSLREADSQAAQSSYVLAPPAAKNIPKESLPAPSPAHDNTIFRTYREGRPSVKQEPNDNDDHLLLQQKASRSDQVNQLLTSGQESNFQTVSSAIKRSNEAGATLLKILNPNPNKKPSLPPIHQESHKSSLPGSQVLAAREPPKKTLSPPSPNFSQQNPNWYTGSEVPPFRGPGGAVETNMPATTSPTTTTTQVGTPSALTYKTYPPPPIQATSSTASTRTTHPKPEDGIQNGMSYKHGGLRPESDKTTAQRLQRELFDIKREISAKVAREAAVIAQLKELKVPSIPDPVKIGFDPSEQMRDDLARLKHELAAERKLREEAECVIADIRREMKAPFVVPSLFDAFVKLSRLTTQGLRTGTGTGDVAPSSSEPIEPPPGPPESPPVTEMSMSSSDY